MIRDQLPDTLTPGALLDRVIRDTPDVCAVMERTDGRVVSTLTFADLGRAAAAAAAWLAERGVRRGDVVAVWLPNWTEAVTLQYALGQLGAISVGVNTRYSVHELAHILTQARPVGVVAPARFLSLDFVGRLQGAVETARGREEDLVPPWVAVVRGTPEQASAFDVGGGAWTFSPRQGATGSGPVGQPGDLENVFTTSGSTGAVKLAAHDQASVAQHALNVADAFGFRPGDLFLGALPLAGVFGFNPAMAAWSAGAGVVLEPTFDAAEVLAGIDALGVTHVVGGDDMLGRVMDAWQEDPRPLPALRRGGIADFEGRAADVVAWAEREFGARIGGVYGSSEVFALTAHQPEERPVSERVRPGGRLVSEAMEVRVVNQDDGRPCAPGELGELQFRGYNVLAEYLGNAAATEKAFTDDGWLRSGDLGVLADDPREFVYTCRAGDALRLRGFLVEPAEIEQLLGSHPAVGVAKVVGVRAEAGSDVAVAFVSPRPGQDLDSTELLEFAKERLAPFKIPAHVNVLESFPVTAGTNGAKIRTAELRRMAAEQVQAAS